MLYITAFITVSGPDEYYFYNSLDDARHHMDLFIGDNSGLYKRIDIVEYSSNEVLESLSF